MRVPTPAGLEEEPPEVVHLLWGEAQQLQGVDLAAQALLVLAGISRRFGYLERNIQRDLSNVQII